MSKEKIILGVDPGTVDMGYGIIEVKGSQLSLLGMGVIQLSKYDNHAVRLKHIFGRIISLIEEYHPDEMAIEAPFYGKNVQSMLKLGRAQGVAIAAAISRDVPYVEYAPKKIKQSVTGSGNASKKQVSGMVNSILGLIDVPTKFDASDAVAAAICHHYQGGKSVSGGKKYSGWKSFVDQNQDLTK